jgi:hypothetical protein
MNKTHKGKHSHTPRQTGVTDVMELSQIRHREAGNEDAGMQK